MTVACPTDADRQTPPIWVLVSGWAFDARIFAPIALPGKVLSISGGPAGEVVQAIRDALDQQRIARVTLLGWSQGAFAASAFAARYPGRVEELILVSARRRYPADALAQVERHLLRNAAATLRQFYKTCFVGQRGDYAGFKETLLSDYLTTMRPEGLVAALRALSQAEIAPQALHGVAKITLVHGEQDALAPVAEATALASELPRCRYLVFADAGHLPFLHRDFSRQLGMRPT